MGVSILNKYFSRVEEIICTDNLDDLLTSGAKAISDVLNFSITVFYTWNNLDGKFIKKYQTSNSDYTFPNVLDVKSGGILDNVLYRSKSFYDVQILKKSRSASSPVAPVFTIASYNHSSV